LAEDKQVRVPAANHHGRRMRRVAAAATAVLAITDAETVMNIDLCVNIHIRCYIRSCLV